MDNNQKGDLISREGIKKVIVEKLEKWSDGYSYIEIPTDDAIKEMASAIEDAETVDISRICMEHYKQGRKDEKAEANGELLQSFSP